MFVLVSPFDFQNMLSHLNLKVIKKNRIFVWLKRTQPPLWIPSEPPSQGVLWQDGGVLWLRDWITDMGQALVCGPCWAVATPRAPCGPHVKGLRSREPGPPKIYPQTGQLFLGISAHSYITNIYKGKQFVTLKTISKTEKKNEKKKTEINLISENILHQVCAVFS